MGLLSKIGVYIRMTSFQNICGDPCLSSLGLAVPTCSQNKSDIIGNTYSVTKGRLNMTEKYREFFFLLVLQNNNMPHF